MPKIDYYLPSGEKIRGTTTVAGRFKESGGLIGWAYKMGQEWGRIKYVEGRDPGNVMYDKKEKAADIGTIAHELIGADIMGRDVIGLVRSWEEIDREMFNKAWKAYGAFCKWRDGSGFKLLCSEVSLVCPEYRLGGTLDSVAMVDGERSLVDWKSGKDIYVETLLQMASYRHLWENGTINRDVHGEHVAGCPPHLWASIERVDVLRVDKKHGGFVHRYWPIEVIDEAWEVFKHMPGQYQALHELKDAIK